MMHYVLIVTASVPSAHRSQTGTLTSARRAARTGRAGSMQLTSPRKETPLLPHPRLQPSLLLVSALHINTLCQGHNTASFPPFCGHAEICREGGQLGELGKCHLRNFKSAVVPGGQMEAVLSGWH